ncbi:MAG TPA: hypothetical protein PKG52_09955, partial [bacterium]|nr:hypothetical protein [bacterium]
MKYFVSKIIPKLSSFSKKLDKISVICDRKWKMLDDEGESTSYIFREKNELLIIKKGEVKKAKWEIINQNDILIEQENASFLFRQAFIDENIFVLNVDGTDSYVYFVDGEKTDVKNIEQLESLLKGKYLPEPKPTIIESNVEAKKQIDSKAKNDSDSPMAVILISIFLIVGVFIAISHLNQKSNSSENEIKKQSPLPSEGLILGIIDTHFDRFIEENSRQENFIYFSGRV